jgi:hypothetical protein
LSPPVGLNRNLPEAGRRGQWPVVQVSSLEMQVLSNLWLCGGVFQTVCLEL